MKHYFYLFLLLVLAFFIVQCSSTRYMPPMSSYPTEDSSYQYSDSTIEAAFRQNPQIDLPLQVAIYDVGYESLELTDTLSTLDEISYLTHISPALIEGPSYYDRLSTPWYYSRSSLRNTSPLQIRTLAAQSHSDLIIYIGSHHEVYSDTNFLAWLYVPLIPMFFVKGNQLDVHSYVDMYIIDVRNGFIYNSYRAKASAKDKFVKVNYEKDLNRLKEQNIASLKKELITEIERVLQREDLQISTQ